jgi:hypothetical protein
MRRAGTHTAIKRTEISKAITGCEDRFATGSWWVHWGVGHDRIGATVYASLTGVPIQSPYSPP